MSLNAVFSLLKSRNIALLEEEGELVIRAPQGAMDEDLLARLKLHKQGLLTALRNGRDVSITPQMLTLVELSQEEIDAIVANVDGGAANIQDIYPLAPLQEGILFHHLLESQGDPYVTRTQIVFENRRYLDHFLAALQTVIERHDILRSAMHWQGLRQPVQVVQRRAKLPVHDLYGGDAEARLSAATDPRQCRMNLQQAPLLQVYIAAEQDGLGWRLVLLNHHLIDDNYTLQLVLSEIRLLLAGRGDELRAPLPYRNFIARMRRTSQAEHEAYFREQLSDVYETTAPFGLLNVQGDGGKVEEATLRLDTELSRRIRDTARSCSVSPAGLLHAVWAVVMGRCSGRDDVVFGTVLSGRLHGGVGAERAVGMFINTLPIRVPLGRHACREVVALTHRRLNSLLAHEQASLATAQRCSAVPSGMPLFTTLINYRHAAIVEADDKALTVWEGARVLFSEERSNYPLTLTVDDFGDEFALSVQAAPEIDPLRIVDYMRTVVEGLVEALRHNPDKAVAEIAMLSAAEKRELLFDWNATAVDYPEASCLQALFEAQVEKTPDAVALSFEDNSLTYAELNAKANQLAHYLIEHGVGPDVLVGICIERSLEMVIGLLGVLKAGGAYVPLDPHYPEERLRYMLDDAGVSLLLTRSGLVELTDFDRQRSFYLDADWLQAAFYPAHNPAVRNRSQDLAYIIYTSGSTGQPKGVAVAHGNALHSTQARFGYYADPVEAYLLLSSFAFDSSVAGIFWTLGQGGCLCLPSEEAGKDPAALAALIERQRVSHLLALPSLYGLLLEQAPERMSSLKAAIVAGEACATEVVKRHFAILPVVKLYNEYGPTEGTVWSSVYQAGLDDLDRTLAIGRPVANVRLYILDKSLNPLPVGVAGELYIGGAGIVRGYLNRPELTAERFIPDPFLAGSGRLYRTGDLARYRADGAIEFLGRIDHQVKIRGFRIELGEIEAELLKQPAVKEAVVMAREDQPGDKRLVAYVVEAQAGGLQAGDLKDELRQTLPDYMLPGAFVILEQMPLSANGKLDRKRLPAPDWNGQAAGRYEAPQNAVEAALAQIWQGLLSVEGVGRHDNFFALGGDSILSIQMVSRARQSGIVVTPKQLFERPTIAELAMVAETASTAVAEQGIVTGDVSLTPIQYWFFEQGFADPHHWNQALMLSVKPGLTPALFEAALRKLLVQHDALRMRFTEETGRWRQSNLGEETHPFFECVDLSAVPGEQRSDLLQAKAGACQASLNLSQGPLLRVVWFELGNGERRVLIVIHHLVVDGVSWRILLEDLESVCRQGMAGQSLSLPAKTTSFQHWAARQLQLTRDGSLDLHADYWLDPRRRQVEALSADEADGANLAGLEYEVVIALSEEQTRYLLQEVAAAYRTQIDDLLWTALILSLHDWQDERVSSLGRDATRYWLIDREGHGREHLADDLDVSRTVGWFTSVYPLLLTVDAEAGLAQTLKSVKEQLRAVPANGISYGLLRYLSADAETRQRLADLPQAEIIFNYLGQLDRGLAADGLFAPASEAVGPSHAAAGERCYELDVVAGIQGERLQLSWRYSRERYHRDSLEKLAERYLQHLQTLIVHCRLAENGGYTPSDFPLAALNQTQLDALHLPVRQIDDLYPLAPLQQGLMFHSLYEPDTQAYRIQLACRLQGPLDMAAFREAWQQLLVRHAVLRSRFLLQGGEQALQIVERQTSLAIAEHDWRQDTASERQARWLALQAADHAQGFDFNQAPLMRLNVVECQADEHYLLWSYHHILIDGWSMPLLIKEVFTTYHALRQGERPKLAPVQAYRDYIAWLQAQDKQAAEAYWRQQLAGFEAATVLGADRGVGSKTWVGEIRSGSLSLTAAASQALQRYVRHRQITLNTLAQAAWGLLLSHYSGNGDVVFGITVSGRPAELAGIENQVGLFINTLPMRVSIDPQQTVGDCLQALFAQNQAMRRYEYSPLAQVQTWSEIGRGQALFESLLVFENYPIDQALATIGGELRIDEVVGKDPTNYPLTLTVFPGDNLRLELHYDDGRFSADEVTRMLAHLQQLLEAFVEQPDAKLANLPTLTPAERQQILNAWNATEVEYPQGRCIHQLFEAQVEKTPNAVALSFEDNSLTYAELNAKANQLAHYLIEHGVGPDVLVGICIERSLEMVIGLLGILKAGGAYVPLDPHYPEERLAFMLGDIAPIAVLTQAEFAGLGFGTAQTLSLDSDWATIETYSVANPRSDIRLENLAYCIYTSGSTGQPKGAGVPHRGILNRLQWMQAEYRLDGNDHVLQKTPYSFDVSVWEFFWPLMIGARLVVVSPELHKDSFGLVDLIRREGVTTLHFVPSMLQAFVETPEVEQCRSVKRVICSGEALPADLVQRFQQKLSAELHNLYGPTEASVDVSYWACPAECREAAIPIGRPIANIRLYILDRNLNLVPAGTPGELHIAGIGLGRGYLQRPGLTAEKFIPDPYGPAGSRMYKSGDLARYRADGAIDYLGRIDHQVKIRGFRIELGEIEAQLLAHPEVKEATVLAREDQPGDKRLVAYLVEDQLGALIIDELKFQLKQALPDYMVPTAFVVLEQMPLSANGKLDRKRLPAPDLGEQLSKLYVAPRTDTETLLAEIWREVLGVEKVGVEDDFFELGGHSLLATQLFFLAQKRLATTATFKAFLSVPTIAAQARLLADGHSAELSIDLEAEARLESSIVPLTGDSIDVAAAQVVLLTGATGFLGVFILADLLALTKARIYCLVRAENEKQAQIRLQRQVDQYELSDRVDFSRIVAVCGDLALPRLGLNDSRHQEIADRVEVIYHNGALVNFVQPYQALKAANVSGTEEVLRLACCGRAKAVHYVSTVSVFSEPPRQISGHREMDDPEQRGNLPNGYAQSKWVAEKLVMAAKARGFQVSIYRPAIVAGDSHTGAWNTGDFWCCLIKGCIQMGYAPSERFRVDMAPVDYMSRSIVMLSLQANAVGSVFHLNHPQPPYSDQWLDCFANLGYSVQRVSYRDWLEKVLVFGNAYPEDFALASLLSSFAEQLRDGVTQLSEDQVMQYDCRVTHQALLDLGVRCAPMDEAGMARYQAYWIKKGFISRP